MSLIGSWRRAALGAALVVSALAVLATPVTAGAVPSNYCNNGTDDISFDDSDGLTGVFVGVDPGTDGMVGIVVACVGYRTIVTGAGGGARLNDPQPDKIGFTATPYLCSAQACTPLAGQSGVEVGTVGSPACLRGTTVYALGGLQSYDVGICQVLEPPL